MTTTQTQIRTLPLDALVLSQTPIQNERRAQFNQDALKELAATIKAVGLDSIGTVDEVLDRAWGWDDGVGEADLKKLTVAQLHQLLFELTLFTDPMATVDQAAKAMRIDTKKLRDQVKASLKAPPAKAVKKKATKK